MTGAGRGNKARSFSDRADRLCRIIVALFLRGTCQLRLPRRSLEESLIVLTYLATIKRLLYFEMCMPMVSIVAEDENPRGNDVE